MRRIFTAVAILLIVAEAAAQVTDSDKALMAKTRALYDAPFRRNLVSFDCAVEFDWRKHVVQMGPIQAAATPLLDRLQAVSHRVFVDRTGAVVSAQPRTPDWGAIEHAAELEQVFNAIVSSGLNAWTPFSTDVIFPVGPTHYSFQKIEQDYKLSLEGPGIEATLFLNGDMRLTSAVSRLPQPLRFTTQFVKGSDGFVLASVKTGSTVNGVPQDDAWFTYTYQPVDGYQLPLQVSVTGADAPKMIWHYTLTCSGS